MRGRGFSVRKIPCPRVSMTCMPGGTVTCTAGQRATGLPNTACCCRFPRHTPHVAAWDASARSTVLDCPRHKRLSASAFSLRCSCSLDFRFLQCCFFFYDFVFLCVVVGQNQYPTATSGFLDGLAAHTAVLLDASHSRRVGVLSERIPASGLSILR